MTNTTAASSKSESVGRIAGLGGAQMPFHEVCLADRVAALESEVADLRAALEALRKPKAKPRQRVKRGSLN
jgi:hypothetical protein